MREGCRQCWWKGLRLYLVSSPGSFFEARLCFLSPNQHELQQKHLSLYQLTKPNQVASGCIHACLIAKQFLVVILMRPTREKSVVAGN